MTANNLAEWRKLIKKKHDSPYPPPKKKNIKAILQWKKSQGSFPVKKIYNPLSFFILFQGEKFISDFSSIPQNVNGQPLKLLKKIFSPNHFRLPLCTATVCRDVSSFW